MNIRFLTNTHIRSNPRDLSIAPVGIVFSGVEIEVENRLYRGAAIEGIDTYFRDSHGWYYWSGRAAIIYKELPAPKDKREERDSGQPLGGSWPLSIGSSEATESNIAPSPLVQSAPEKSTPSPDEGHASADDEENLPSLPDEKVEAVSTDASPTTSPGISSTEDYRASHPLLSSAFKAMQLPALFWERQQVFGEDTLIAILDGPVDPTHSDLQTAIRADFDELQGFAPQGTTRTDRSATLRAGLIAGSGKDSLLGLAPSSTLLTVDISLGTNGTDIGRLLEGLDWAGSKGADIVLIGADLRAEMLSHAQKQQLKTLVSRLRRKGLLLVAPVGNGQLGAPQNRFPACLPDCLSVGSLNKNNERAPYSLRSTTLDLMAPGEQLFSLGQKSPAYSTANAAAFVAGLSALLLEVGRRKDPKFEAKQLKSVLRASAAPRFPLNKCRDIDYGCGIVYPEGALKALI